MSSEIYWSNVVFGGGLVALSPVVFGPSVVSIARYDSVPTYVVLVSTIVGAVLLCASIFMRPNTSRQNAFASSAMYTFVLGLLAFVSVKKRHILQFLLTLIVITTVWFIPISSFNDSLVVDTDECIDETGNPLCPLSRPWEDMYKYSLYINYIGLSVLVYLVLVAVAYFRSRPA